MDAQAAKRLPRQGLGKLLFIRVLLFSLVLTLLFTFVQAWQDYRARFADVHRSMDDINNVQVKGIVAALWNFDHKILAAQIDGARNLRYINYVAVIDNDRTVIEAGTRKDQGVIIRETPLSYRHLERDVPLGVLYIQADKTSVVGEVADRIANALLFSTATVAITAFFFFWLFNRLVTSHLYSFAKYFNETPADPDTMFVPLRLNKKWRHDELDVLAEAVNDMKASLSATCGQLRQSRDTFSALYNETPVLMHSIDAEGRIAEVNNHWLKTLGYEREEVLGKKSTDFLSEASRKRALEVVLPAFFRDGFVKDISCQFVKKNGDVMDVLLSATSERDAAGRVVLSLTVIEDVTERKRIARILVESEGQFRALVEQSITGIAVIQNGIFAYVNPRLAEMFGYPPGQMIGLSPTDFVAEPDREMIRESLRKWMSGELSSEQVAFRILRKDGVVRHVELFSSAIIYKDARAFLSTLLDITERKKSEQALRESEARISLILNSTAEGIYGLDQTGNCTFCNAAGVRMLGYRSEQDLLGKNMHGLMHHTKADGTAYPKDQCLAVKVLSDGEYVHSDKEVLWGADGCSFLAEYWAHPIQRDGRTIGAVVTFIDITEHRKLEDQLRQAQKMEAIGQLAGGVAHDFNNILSAIIGYGHLTLMKMQENDPVRHYIEQILQSSERATALTQSLLAFGRKQLVKKELIKLDSVIGNFEKFLARLLREDIELKTQYSDEELTIVADRGQIEQVIMNLVTNARDAMPAKGRLTIETRLEVLDETFVSAHGYGRPGEYAMISVSDTGIGMDEATQRKIFEPFFTTKEQGKGTGLGLATVYGIVKTHEGFINVYSEPGKGTVFHIYIPLVRSAEEVREPVAQAPVPLKGGTETILLAEDDESLRKMTSVVLRHVGYAVIEAENGQDAVRRFIENKDVIRLVILDGIMPVMNGKEAYREISALCPDMRCIFMSGYAEDIFTKDGILQTDVEFISKPVTPSALLHKVREVLDR